MSKVGLFYGSTTGKTESAAEMIQSEFGGSSVVTLHEIADVSDSDFEQYDFLIIGAPTWDIGELQADWDGFYNDDLDSIDFSGKTVAYFGTGDQLGYEENFQDAMGILESKISSLGGKTVGYWPTDGYEHEASKAEKNGKFVGLALDEDNQSELTESRIKTWVAQVKKEFGI
ncbi:flavodoxin, long chain [Xenococcus sp. PCC 7305]|uniref:flavodoxin FldA n=1 Tax=Xenococcus sp. PCC 7305 TaxID=102125 RepID=UPI0002ACFF82|nr:flavodoxin FldA [Xenococcus sp. PCC 7305]ELS04431.1 flavodoxin, long chain [Xenococcus sp. PCC 7305]